MEYSNEHLNFFRICFITTNIVTEGLRKIFKQQWDKRYKLKASFGVWVDSGKNGLDFERLEPLESQTNNERLLKIIRNGNTKEWDCTALFFGILFSTSIGKSLNPSIYRHVNDLRVFRNDIFAHVAIGTISDSKFNSLIGRVKAAFLGLSLPVCDIKSIANQKSFPTKESRLLRNQLLQEQEEVRSLQQKSSALEEELKSRPKTFLGNLPTLPSHAIQERPSEVSMILGQMKELKESNEGVISTIYLSGNPGCGKSQTARMVGEMFYKQLSGDDPTFVAALIGETLETLFSSYDRLSRALSCTEFAVSRIITSRDSMAQKLEQFQRLVTPKMKEFSSWLIIVDNVVDLDAVRRFWPASGSREYGNGQILVTTQDSRSLPGNGPRSRCISLSQGMDPQDAVNLLTKVSQMPNQEEVEDVAKALDYQPLALACAAWYVSNMRCHGSPNFSWKKYLEKLENGREEAMGEIKKKCESGYTMSMPVAVRMAVDRAVANEQVLLYTFQFLSICAPRSIPIEIVVDFVRKRIPNFDNEDIKSRIMESSLVQISSIKEGKETLWLHQVLYRATKSSIPPEENIEVISAALSPLQRLTVTDASISPIFVEHFSAFLEYVISVQLSFVRSPEFYGQLAKVITLGDFLECFISCAFVCLDYGKLPIVNQSLEKVKHFMQMDMTVNEETLSLLFFFCGRASIEISELVDAIKYLERSLAIRRRIHGNKHRTVAECLRYLGRANFNFSCDEKAAEFYREALAIFRQIYGLKHKDVAECLVGLGNARDNLSCHDEADEYFQEALSISRELFGSKHLIVARCLHNLGTSSIDRGHYQKAERFLEEALTIQIEICGEKEERVAIIINNLGRLHLKCLRFEKARQFMERAFNIRCAIGNQLRVGRSLYFLGYLSEMESKISSAEDYYRQALTAIRQYDLPDYHLYVRETVEALQRMKSKAKNQRETTDNLPISRKRKAANWPEEHSRQVIKC